jgi:chromosome segregation ATPase
MSSLHSNSSDTAKSTVTRATSTNTVALKREQAYGAFKRLKDYMKEISEFETEYADFDKIIHERDAVVDDLQAIKDKFEKRERETDVLKSCQKLDLEQFLAKTESLKEEKSQMVERHSLEKQQAEKVLHLHQTKIASINTELERAKDEIRLTKAQLEASNQELAQWGACLSRLRPLNARDL